MNLSAAKVYTNKPLGKKTIQGNGELPFLTFVPVMNLSAAKVYTDKPLGKKTIQGNSERYSLPLHPYKA
jgi:hypothetical protein